MKKVSEPIVSVIVTTKNEEKNIGRLLVSVKNQTYTNREVIVVDNNSSDNTKIIAKKYGAEIYNQGPERSAQRNYGVQKARGNYVLILDADMELSKNVISDCVRLMKLGKYKALVIAEKTVGKGMIAKIRAFERSMYMGDVSVEVARFFEKRVFIEFGGYDLKLTGAEDYDLPYRISSKYRLGRSKKWIFHHEGDLSYWSQLKKKYYYANKSSLYVEKHPRLVLTQGVLVLRKAYLRNWKKFLKNPLISILFFGLRISETFAAAWGYYRAVGPKTFLKTVSLLFK